MSEPCGYFVTGTDTGVGKTVVTLGLMQCLQSQGHAVAAMKPLASGCDRLATGIRNDDALLLQQQASVVLAYEQVNPYAFEPAIAPHIAAAQCGARIDPEKILQAYSGLAGRAVCVVVEGVGGWRVPLGERRAMAVLARGLGLPVVLVVGLRLGCLNHALLTADSIAATGCTLAGWVANRLPPPPECAQETISSLKSMINGPLLGAVPVLSGVSAGAIADHLSL